MNRLDVTDLAVAQMRAAHAAWLARQHMLVAARGLQVAAAVYAQRQREARASDRRYRKAAAAASRQMRGPTPEQGSLFG